MRKFNVNSRNLRNHIIEIELDKRKCYKFRNPIYLCEYVESIVNEKKDEKYYLFIDEVQLTKKVKDQESGIEVISMIC